MDEPFFEWADASRVTEQLWVGGSLATYDSEKAEAQLAELMRHGVTHVLDVRQEWSDEDWVAERAPAVRYLHLGVDDAGQKMADDWFARGTEFVSDALQHNDSRILVHCHMGINRGPSMGFASLLTQGWEPVAALTLLHEARPIAWVDYAEDATDWWARRRGLPEAERAALRDQVSHWRCHLGIDRATIFRGLR